MDSIWLHQNELWEYMQLDGGLVDLEQPAGDVDVGLFDDEQVPF